MTPPASRGSSGFEVDAEGAVLATENNVEALRALWASRPPGLEVGPGVGPAGAWHVSCHLVAGGCVRRTTEGQTVWLEISHRPANDTYQATVTHDLSSDGLDSPSARQILDGSTLLGFVEGTSEGHISAPDVADSPARFEGWMRQNYDQPPGSTDQGGRVWEHWCTTRDLDPGSELSVSLLTAYLQLCNAAGDRLAPTVARGRTTYGHPGQLRALVDAGFTSGDSAAWPTTPKPIDREAELLLQEATPQSALEAARSLPWSDEGPSYFMFPRKIGDWAG